jgi:hypothetical protein
MEKGARIVLPMAKGNFVTLGKYLVVLHTVGGDSKDWGKVKAMTKHKLIQAAKEIRDICKKNRICTKCPFSYIKDYGAGNVCVFDTEFFYPEGWKLERLERESNDD